MQAIQFINDIPTAVAVRAFQGTSFSPEKRAESYRFDYAETMASDYEDFKRHAEKGGTLDKLDDAFARYRSGYASRYCAWLSSHSRCISWMITGPSNFPTRRAQKWNTAAHNRMTEVIAYREQVKRSILRDLRPDLRPIMAGDANAIERLAVELAHLERNQLSMKMANAGIRKHAKEGAEAQTLALVELGFSPQQASELLNPPHYRVIGFPSYRLTNNGANIRRVRQRLEHLEKMHSLPVQEVQGEGVRVEVDPPANRVRLFFDGKPDAETRERLKSCGFRWTPSLEAWQAYINYRTQELARSFVKIAP
ncbi:hypothetical protein J2X19_005106 [Rhodoferax ferrireducens]|uniref:Uncharacterized protein n=1 Tax=Rhodoferax ferrireducens TaxID=192843 RepID=A0ABU2CGD2_9BURK|nr:hypothetical protein [Rhodoferax ferrireducens]MDR7380399.1 hypothetical protein [Rhodoferax ferrireducens]